MFLKKIALITSTVATLGLPVLASASLETYNNTNEFSAVKVAGVCTGNPPLNKFTPPHGHLTTSPLDVNMICHGASPCYAELFASKDCSGSAIGALSIIPRTLAVSIAAPIQAPYKVVITAPSTVTISYL